VQNRRPAVNVIIFYVLIFGKKSVQKFGSFDKI
jgi:hypothetical protein